MTLKLIAKISKFFAALLVIFKVPTKLFYWSNKIRFKTISSKILDPPTNHSLHA